MKFGIRHETGQRDVGQDEKVEQRTLYTYLYFISSNNLNTSITVFSGLSYILVYLVGFILYKNQPNFGKTNKVKEDTNYTSMIIKYRKLNVQTDVTSHL